MITTPEQFAVANKAAVDSMLSLANTALASAERIAALNLNTARSVLEDSVANTKAILAHLGEELLVALLTSKQTGEQDARSIHREQGPDAVELGREDLEHDEGEGELADGGTHVGALKRALCRANFHQLGPGQHD